MVKYLFWTAQSHAATTDYERNFKSTGTLRHVLRSLQTTINDLLQNAGLPTQNKPALLSRSQQLPARYKRIIIDGIKQN